MASLNLTNPTPIAQIFITLSDNSTVAVPDGADPDAYRRFCEARLRLAANPKPKRKSYVRSSKPNKRVNYAGRALVAVSPFDAGMEATAKRMDELATMYDEKTFAGGIEWDIPFMGEPIVYQSEADDYGLQPAW